MEESNKYREMVVSPNNISRNKKEYNSLRMKFDLTMMDSFCSYVLSDNGFIHRNGLTNLKNLLEQIDPNLSLDNSQSLIDRYNLCMDVLHSRLDKNLSRKELIIADIQGLLNNKYKDLSIENFRELNANEVSWIESDILPKYLNAALINNSIYDLQELCSMYAVSNPDQMPDRIDKIYDKIDEIYVKKRRNEIDADTEDSLFQLSKYENTVTQIWNTQKSGGYRLRTGIKCLNKILNGGLEEGRVYCLFGPSGGGKSLTIANLLCQIKKYNSDVKCKDPTLKPCVVLLTMENMISEVVQTLYNITVANEDISNRPLDEVLNLIGQSDIFVDEYGNRSPIEIFVKFKPINSITTDYLYKLTEELKDEGYEVICMMQDYIMRIKSIERNNVEDRVKYGNIINEFKNYAMYYSIPVVTAAQLNRDASRTIDSFKADGKYDDMMDRIGRANIAESSQIDFNLDAIIFIIPCWEGDIKWQAFKLIKHRYKADLLPSDYIFFHPFVQGLPAKLEEDFERAEPLSKHNMIYDKESSQTAQAFSNASNDMNNSRFSKNKSLKNDNTVIMKDGQSNGFLSSLTMTNPPPEESNRSDYEDGKNKLSIAQIIEEENMDETIFYDTIKYIVNYYGLDYDQSKYRYKEEVDMFI